MPKPHKYARGGDLIKSFPHYLKNLFSGLLFIGTAIAAIIFSREVSFGARRGMLLCLDTLVPSLFPFMVLSIFVAKTELVNILGKAFNPLVKVLFGLPTTAATTVVLGLFGGYPSGALGVNTLLNRGAISTFEAGKMLLFVVCGGPAFAISIVGAQLLKNTTLGIFLFLSQIISTIFMGILVNITHPKPLGKPTATAVSSYAPYSRALVEACCESAFAIINMCALVVAFSVFAALLEACRISIFFAQIFQNLGLSADISRGLIPTALEVTSASSYLAKSCVPLAMVAFALGWAGLCVHFQIFSIFEHFPASKLKFIFFRALHGVLSALILGSLLTLCNFQSVPVFQRFSPSSPSNLSFSRRNLTLIFLCVCFLCAITDQNLNFSKRKMKNEKNLKEKNASKINKKNV